MSAFVRFILGDLPAARELGRCDAHEHVVIGGPFVAQHFPGLDLSDTDAAVRELARFTQAGGGWVVDTMPTGPGRQPAMLAEVSRRSDVPIVMPTGRHLAQYYPAGDGYLSLDRDAMAQHMIEEITQGVDGHRCGLIKVAGGRGKLNEFEREAFAAAAFAQRATGCPVLTHTEADAEGVHDQIKVLEQHGADLSKVSLSHVDKNPDASLHRDVLQSGVRLEYDQHFRRVLMSDAREPGPFALIADMAGAFPDSVVLGMDLARRTYWAERGGRPGLAWLLTDLVQGLQQVGLTVEQIDRLFIDNALAAFSFSPVTDPTDPDTPA